MTGPSVEPTTTSGGRKLSQATKDKLRDINRARFAALTPEQQEAQRARLRAIGPGRRSPAPPAPPAPSSGGPRNPLDDALGAAKGGGPSSPGRSNGHVAPPRFVIPDLPPLAPANAGDELEDLPQPSPDELAGFTVDPGQIADLLSMPFDFVADRRGAHWRLKPLERERLAGAIARKVNEHTVVARALDAGGDWIIIIGGLAVVVSARLAEDARHAEPEPDRNPARPGLAGITLPGRRSGAGSGAPAAAARPGPDAVHLDGAGSRPGTINGFGTAPGTGDQADAAEAPRQLAQSFG